MAEKALKASGKKVMKYSRDGAVERDLFQQSETRINGKTGWKICCKKSRVQDFRTRLFYIDKSEYSFISYKIHPYKKTA